MQALVYTGNEFQSIDLVEVFEYISLLKSGYAEVKAKMDTLNNLLVTPGTVIYKRAYEAYQRLGFEASWYACEIDEMQGYLDYCCVLE